jgi:RNA processing factor Prp31
MSTNLGIVDVIMEIDDEVREWFNRQYEVYEWRWNELRGTQQWNLN